MNSKKFGYFLAVVISIVISRCGYSQQDKNDATAKSLITFIKKNVTTVKSLHKLRPSYRDCRTIAADQRSSILLWHYGNEFYETLENEREMPLSTKSSSLSILNVLNSISDISTVNDNLSPPFKKPTAWYFVAFQTSADEKATAYSGFVHVNGRWILIPKISHAFSSKKVPPVYATVLKMLSLKRNQDAYDLCSPRITEQLKRADADTFFAKIGFSKIRKFERKTDGTRTVNDFSSYHLGGIVSFEDGRSGNVNMLFERDQNDDLKLAWIGLQSRLGVEPPSLFAPLPYRCRDLTKALMSDIILAVKDDDFEKLQNQSAKSVRQFWNAEVLKKGLSSAKNVSDAILKMDVNSVTLVNPPSLGQRSFSQASSLSFRPENEPVPKGPLQVDVTFSDKAKELTIVAHFAFVFEDKKWRPRGYSFEMPVAKTK